MFFYFSDNVKKDRRIASISNMIHNSIIIQSHTRIRSDGKIESYCGLKLREIITQEGGKHKQIYIFIKLLINTIMLKNETIFTESSKISRNNREPIKQKEAVSSSNMPKNTRKRYKGTNFQLPPTAKQVKKRTPKKSHKRIGLASTGNF